MLDYTRLHEITSVCGRREGPYPADKRYESLFSMCTEDDDVN